MAHLAALRHTAGLSQAELARIVGVPQANIAFWERCEKPPRSDVLPKLAKALGVEIEALLHPSARVVPTPPPGRGGRIHEAFEQVRQLPRRQQLRVIEFVSFLVDQHKRRAS